MLDPLMLLALGAGLAALGRGWQMRKDWVRHGLGYFSWRYMLLVGVGNGLTALALSQLQATLATALALLVCALYAWMLMVRLEVLAKSAFRRLLQRGR